MAGRRARRPSHSPTSIPRPRRCRPPTSRRSSPRLPPRRARALARRLRRRRSPRGARISAFTSSCRRSATRARIEYGGSFENRIRLCLEVVDAVRGCGRSGRPLFVRISATDWTGGGWDIEQSVELARPAARPRRRSDRLLVGRQRRRARRFPSAAGYQVPFAERIRREAGVPTGAVGLITSPRQADDIVASGRADCVLLARELLRDPYWPLRAAASSAHACRGRRSTCAPRRRRTARGRSSSRQSAVGQQQSRRPRTQDQDRDGPVPVQGPGTRECTRCSSKTTTRSRSSSRAACARPGFAVDRVADGDDGLEAALEQPYDVAVVDVMLPKRDGLSRHRRAAPARRRDAGADSERAAIGGRSRPGPAGRRRRLPDQAVRVRRAAGARAGAGAARLAHAGTDDADGRGSRARSAVAPRHARRHRRSICARASSRCSST